MLDSIYKVDGAASQLKLSAHFDTKTSNMVELSAPSDKGNRGKITWIKNSLKKVKLKTKSFLIKSKKIFLLRLIINFHQAQ